MAEEKQNKKGFIEWEVDRNLLLQFKNAKHKQVFCSPQFIIDGTIWRIRFYPHGDKSPDDCSISLQCVKLNAKKQRIGVNYSFNIKKLAWSHDDANTFTHDGALFRVVRGCMFKSKQIDNLQIYFDTMTIKCFVEETMDVNEANTYFEWKINNYLLQKWKNAKRKQKFFSPTFKAVGAEWFMRIYPNGWYTKGTADLDIKCWHIDSAKKEIHFCHYIAIDALNHCQINFDGNTIKSGDHITSKSPFKSNDIQFEITIGVRIWEKGSTEDRMMIKLPQESWETVDNLQQVASECLKTIDHLNSQMASLKQENEAIGAKLRSFAMRDLKKEEDNMKLKNENERLRTENTQLNEECKETKLELIRVKTEFRKVALDPTKYLQWSDSEVVDWIASIDGGKFAVYEEHLRLVFASEGVNGLVLSEISKPDLKDWGIKSFRDRSDLYKQIQQLMNKNDKNMHQDAAIEGITAYIG